MTRHIKLFENYRHSLDEEVNLIYEDWKSSIPNYFFDSLSSILENEDESEEEDDDFWIEKSEMTSGERAAIARDFQVLHREHLAAIYLRALGKLENDTSKYLSMIPGIKGFGKRNKYGYFSVPVPALADALGLVSIMTVYRTSEKFFNLLTGEAIENDPFYPKILKAYNYFKDKEPRFLSNMIPLNHPSEFTFNRDQAQKNAIKAREKREESKKKTKTIGESVHRLVTELKKIPKYKDNAIRLSIEKISQEKGIDQSKLKGIYKNYLKSIGSSTIGLDY